MRASPGEIDERQPRHALKLQGRHRVFTDWRTLFHLQKQPNLTDPGGIETDLAHPADIDALVLDHVVAAQSGNRLPHVDKIFLVTAPGAARPQPQHPGNEGQRQRQDEQSHQYVLDFPFHTDACAARPRGP